MVHDGLKYAVGFYSQRFIWNFIRISSELHFHFFIRIQSEYINFLFWCLVERRVTVTAERSFLFFPLSIFNVHWIESVNSCISKFRLLLDMMIIAKAPVKWKNCKFRFHLSWAVITSIDSWDSTLLARVMKRLHRRQWRWWWWERK